LKDRQIGPIERIRADHVKRYLFATIGMTEGETVLDLACGCGYGSFLMHGTGAKVTGMDIEPEAIAYCNKHYQGPEYLCQRAEDTKGTWDKLVMFETLEHLDSPLEILRAIDVGIIIASVPNQAVAPFNPKVFKFDKYPHRRHYTPEDFESLLTSAGFEIVDRHCQHDRAGEVFTGTNGMFLIYTGKR